MRKHSYNGIKLSSINSMKRFEDDDEEGEGILPALISTKVFRVGTDIYFYDEINEESQLKLFLVLQSAISEIYQKSGRVIALTGELPDCITIHINSPGGYANCGFAIYDTLKEYGKQIPIHTVAEGLCASAATLMFLASEDREMTDHSVFLMHQSTWGDWGKNNYMQDQAQNAKTCMDMLRSIYLKETKFADGLPVEERAKKLDELLSHDFDLTKEDCIKMGIIEDDDEGEEIELSPENSLAYNQQMQQLEMQMAVQAQLLGKAFAEKQRKENAEAEAAEKAEEEKAKKAAEREAKKAEKEKAAKKVAKKIPAKKAPAKKAPAKKETAKKTAPKKEEPKTDDKQ